MDIVVIHNRIFSLFGGPRPICHSKSSGIVNQMKSIVSTHYPSKRPCAILPSEGLIFSPTFTCLTSSGPQLPHLLNHLKFFLSQLA